MLLRPYRLTVWNAGLMMILVACGDTHPRSMPSTYEARDDIRAGKADRISDSVSSTVDGIGTLQYQALERPAGTFHGPPLMVSNNPEHVYTFGLLASTSPPVTAPVEPRGSDSPQPTIIGIDDAHWADRFDGCNQGQVKRIDLYLAHILDREMARDRRLSIVVEGSDTVPTTIEWSVELGTSHWSDFRGYKTKRKDWLGAHIARTRMSYDEPSHQSSSRIQLDPGQSHVIATVRAKSLVEGIARLQGYDGCFKVHIVAHPPGGLESNLVRYAEGDVLWPGWSNGAGYGRAAGLFEGNRWRGHTQKTLTSLEETFGWLILDASTSPSALARHGDSSDILFGGYGVVYEFETELTNETNRCISVLPAFTSYARFASDSPSYSDAARTPSWSTLRLNRPRAFPTMVWNGPVHAEYELRGGASHRQSSDVILTVDIKSQERANPDRVIRSLSTTLFRLDMTPGEQRTVVVKFPVPGYIVAPVAIAFETRPCES